MAIIIVALNIRTRGYTVTPAKSPITSALTSQTNNKDACPTSASTPMPCGVSGSWSIKFDDEFNGNSLNKSYWADTWSTGSMNNVKTDPSNISVSSGKLILTLSSPADGALVTTNPYHATPGFQFGTGYFVEARIYFPGDGTSMYNWPAFWLLGHQGPNNGETDIAEGTGTLNTYYHFLTGSGDTNPPAGVWSNEWHTYAVDREPGEVKIYWDGKLVRSSSTDDNGQLQYIILNLGTGAGPNDTVVGPESQMKVDYVRAWQKM